MTHPPCGRPLLFVGAAVAVIALFLGLAAGPASAGPDLGARVPAGKSGDPGPKSNKNGEAKKKSEKTDERANPGPAARPGKDAVKRPHAGNGPPGHRGGQSDKTHHDKTKVKAASEDNDEDSHDAGSLDAGRLELSRQGAPQKHDSVDTATADATQPVPLRNPGRDLRTLSSGAAGIPISLTPAPASAPAEGVTDPPHPPDPVIGGALDPPLLGAGPSPSQWAPFVPALDEPAFPAILLAALALFLALFGRGDRRDPKLVEAVVDDRAQDVDFS